MVIPRGFVFLENFGHILSLFWTVILCNISVQYVGNFQGDRRKFLEHLKHHHGK